MNDSKVNVVVSGHRNDYHSTYKTYILRGGIPFADQVIMPDTKYVIKYDFDLGSDSIEIPANCILKFEGGSLNNGTLVGQNTKIDACNDGVFSNIQIQGTWNVPKITSRLFKNLSSVNALKQVFNLTNENINNKVTIEKEDYDYVFSFEELFEHAILLNSNTDVRIDGTITVTPNGLNGYRIFYANDVKNIKIYGNGTLIGDADGHAYTATQEYGGQTLTTHEYCHAFCIYNSEDVYIQDLEISKFPGDGIAISNTWYDKVNNSVIKGLSIHDCGRQGISAIQRCLIIENCHIWNITRTAPSAAIDLEPNNNDYSVSNVIIRNCYFHNCVIGVSMIAYNGHVDGITIENCRVENITNHGFYTSGEASSIIIRNNSIKDIGSVAFNLPRIKGCLIANNIVTSNNRGFYLNPSNNHPQYVINNIVTAKSNTFVNNSVVKNNYFYYIQGGDYEDFAFVISGKNNCIENNYIEGYIRSTAEFSSFIQNKVDFPALSNKYCFIGGTHAVFKNNEITVHQHETDRGRTCFLLRTTFFEGSFNKFIIDRECMRSAFEIEGTKADDKFLYHDIALFHNDFEESRFLTQTIVCESTKNIIIKGLYSYFQEGGGHQGYYSANHDTQEKNQMYVDAETHAIRIYDGSNSYVWNALGQPANVRKTGLFVQKPHDQYIDVGFNYFCTDRHINPADMSIVSGAGGGMEITYKGLDTTDPENPVEVWVDALGRVVS